MLMCNKSNINLCNGLITVVIVVMLTPAVPIFHLNKQGYYICEFIMTYV